MQFYSLDKAIDLQRFYSKLVSIVDGCARDCKRVASSYFSVLTFHDPAYGTESRKENNNNNAAYSVASHHLH
jgi:hypothetical protein